MALNYLAPAAEEMNGGLCHLLRDKKEAVLGVRGQTSSLGDVLSFRCGDVLGEVSHRQWDTPVWSGDPGSELELEMQCHQHWTGIRVTGGQGSHAASGVGGDKLAVNTV